MQTTTKTATPAPWRIGRDTTCLGTWTLTNGVKTRHFFRRAEALAALARQAVRS